MLKIPVYQSKVATLSAGFSMVELLVYLALLSLMLTTLAALFFSVLDFQLFSTSKSAVSADTNFITSRLRYDLDQSTAVSNPDVAGSESSRLNLTIDGKDYEYALNGTLLEVTGPDAATAISDLSTLVTDLQFARLGSSSGKNTITASMTLQSLTDQNRGREATKSVSITLGLKEE